MKRILVVVTFGFMAMHASSLDLNEAVISRGKDTVRNEAERLASPIITSVINANGGKPGRGLAYTNLGGGNHWYRLYNKMVIVGVEASAQSLIGRWPLTRWPYEVDDAEVAAIYAVEGAQEGDVWDRYESNRYLNTETLGCLANIPLRYGDLESDGVNELVLPLGNNDQQVDWVVFSPTAGKIIFSARIALQDFFEAPDNAWAYYLSDAAGPKALMGKRAYAKLYFSDFDKNAKEDILVWRKQYSSLTKKNSSVKGFKLKHQNYRHYELINGEYLPQKTDSATIKNWLKTSKLTWQKGFPSISECAGQKGQLIPEMHDVLLNDPDVLQ
ncbi:hypothetical protein [Marinagarivorans algicola]|uniref:hypothetical protein n=1 Tax=Marinagarivorans algicola TaxID=1513270 RepID=UPI003735F6FA